MINGNLNSKLFYAITIIIFMLLQGCSTLPTLPSLTSIYDNEGSRLKNPPAEAYDQYERSITYEFTYEDLFDATKSAFFRQGLEVQSDISKGIIMANGRVYPRGATIPVSYTTVAIIKVIDNKPTTEITLKVDAFYDIFIGGAIRWGGKEANEMGGVLRKDIQIILASY